MADNLVVEFTTKEIVVNTTTTSPTIVAAINNSNLEIKLESTQPTINTILTSDLEIRTDIITNG